MHSSAPHRARIIAGRSAHAEHELAAPDARLRRQAERFRLLRAGADATDDTQAKAHAQAALPETPGEPDAPAGNEQAHDQARDQSPDERGGKDDGERGDDGGGRDEARHSGHAESAPESAPEAGAWAFAPTGPHVGVVHGVRTAKRAGTHVAAAEVPACAGQDLDRLVESIVAQVADFCSNPAVLERGDWHITIPIDSALLPGCTLTLTLSRFDLTLRFDTSDERSRQLILRHAMRLRESLQQVMQARFEASRGIEISVF